MRKIKTVIKSFGVVFLFSFLLAGCASGPQFKEVVNTFPAVPAESGRIYIYRPSAFGAAIQPKIRVNDEVVGTAQARGFTYVDRPAGEYEIATSTEAKRKLKLTLEPGDEKYVRLEVKMGLLVAQIKPVQVESDVGQSQLEKTKFMGATDVAE